MFWAENQTPRPWTLLMLETKGREHYFNFKVEGFCFLPNISWTQLVFFHQSESFAMKIRKYSPNNING